MSKKTKDLTRREFVKQAGLGAAAIAVASAAPLNLSQAATIKNGMGYRTLGRTGLEISEVALGGGSLSETESNLVRMAVSKGINFLETSSNYRRSQAETTIGKTVKSMGIRDKVIILTKTGNLAMSRMLNASASEVEKAIRDELEGSLQRLETDYIDVFICPYSATSPEEAASPALQEALEKFKKEGKIRFTGVSTHTDYANVCMAAIEEGYHDTIVLPINFATVHPQIRDIVMGSISSNAGASGKGGKQGGKGGGKRGGKRRGGGRQRAILDVRDVLKAAQKKNIGVIAIKGGHEGFLPPSVHDQIKSEVAASDTKLSFHQLAYRYVLDQPQVSAVTIRMTSMLHLDEALVLSQKTLKG